MGDEYRRRNTEASSTRVGMSLVGQSSAKVGNKEASKGMLAATVILNKMWVWALSWGWWLHDVKCGKSWAPSLIHSLAARSAVSVRDVLHMLEKNQIMDCLSKLDIHRSGNGSAVCKFAERNSQHWKASLPIPFESLWQMFEVPTGWGKEMSYPSKRQEGGSGDLQPGQHHFCT